MAICVGIGTNLHRSRILFENLGGIIYRRTTKTGHSVPRFERIGVDVLKDPGRQKFRICGNPCVLFQTGRYGPGSTMSSQRSRLGIGVGILTAFF